MKTARRNLVLAPLISLTFLCTSCDDDYYRVLDVTLEDKKTMMQEKRLVIIPPGARCEDYRVKVPGVLNCQDCASALAGKFDGLQHFSASARKDRGEPSKAELVVTVHLSSFCSATQDKSFAKVVFSKDTFENTQRALKDEFQRLREALDEVENTSTALVPGGGEIVAARVAQAVPTEFNDSLYYAFGAGTGGGARGKIDLKPGMRLRVEYTTFNRYINEDDTTVDDLQGYQGSGVGHYQVTRRTYRVDAAGMSKQRAFTDFDAFMGLLKAFDVEPKIDPQHKKVDKGINLVGGIIDLQVKDFHRRFYRLVYPDLLLPSREEPDTKQFGKQNYFPLVVAADRLADLETAAPLQQPGFTCQTGKPAVCLAFRGRTFVVPEIQVRVHNTRMYVPVGTTAQSLIAGLRDFSPEELRRRLVLYRQFGDSYVRVKFNTRNPASVELPLTKGDVVRW